MHAFLRFPTALLAALVLFSSTARTARAQVVAPPGAASTEAAPAPEAPAPPFARLRFDILGGVLGGVAQSARVTAGSLSPAAQLDLGIQLGDHAALFARAEGGTIGLTSAGAVYLAGEWTPLPALSLGTGIGYDGMSIASIVMCDGGTRCANNAWSGVSVPLFLGINIARKDGGDPSRGRVRLEIEAAGGYDARTETWGIHGFVGVGGAWM